jgi:hypothetical protein
MSPSLAPPSTLAALANRCLLEPPSRAMDATIFCIVHNTADRNSFSTPTLIEARARGRVLLNEPTILGWVTVPRYTEDLNSAKSLVPDGLSTISRDPRIVCATALMALALTGEPELPELLAS